VYFRGTKYIFYITENLKYLSYYFSFVNHWQDAPDGYSNTGFDTRKASVILLAYVWERN